MLKIKSALSTMTILIFINAYGDIINPNIASYYLHTEVPQILTILQSARDGLLTQRRTIDITKQTIDALANKKEIFKDEADKAKQSLERVFDNNFKKSSAYQKVVYNMNRPFQFAYLKIINPHASYLERFAYTAAAAVGVAITGYAVYQGGKYVYSFMPEKSDKTFDVLNAAEQQKINTVITLASADELNANIATSHQFIKRHPKLAKKIIDACAGKDMTPLQAMKEVGPIVNDYFSEFYHEPINE